MVLTEEQKERIRKNRERALKIQRERLEEKKKVESKSKQEIEISQQQKEQKIADSSNRKKTPQPTSCASMVTEDQYQCDAPLEDFEEGASEWVTKKEAMTVYCLPEGTMAICSYEEKQNPRNPLFRPMKLYKRSEIRYRARKRFGGLEGLVEERNKRRKRKLERDMEEARNIFE